MKRYLDTHPTACRLLSLALMAGLALPLPSLAAPVALATAPLNNATTTSVLPNLMFILDNSGSMGQDYTPDYMSRYNVSVANGSNPWTDNDWTDATATEKNCKDSADDDGLIKTALSSMDLCVVGDVPYMTSAMNSQYYNPAILYSPGVNYDGTSKPSQTDPAKVLTDAYGKQKKTQLNVATDTIDLTTKYPDRVWCTTDHPSAADLTDTTKCRKNSDYLYPNATYKYGRSSDNNSSNVWGVYGAPYYYDVVPSEYCKAADLKVCTPSSAPTGEYIFPAKSRWCSNTALTACQATKTATYKYPRYVGVGATPPPYTFVRTDIVSTTATYPKAATRTDCSGEVGPSGCAYAQEITNFANWYAYYRTRMQGMKSAASNAFKPIDNRYRVGFYTINSPVANYLPIAKFDNLPSGSEAVNQKSTWYARLFNAVPSGGTPLRSTLSTVGRIFAGQKPIGTSDPMQYSCQQNFSLLTTDGYWNTDAASDVKNLSADAIGNLDGGTTPRPMYEGPTATSATLADASKYYYDTDLRTTDLGNCTGAPVPPSATGLDVCENNVFVSGADNNVKQHMTTFTLGLGVDGTLTYSSDYNTVKDLASAPADARLDYYNLYHGTGSPVVNWPVPAADKETAVDDLWHAAVNGLGTYFSAKDPAQLTKGLNDALAAIGSKLGAGAAAATSTLDITPGDNFAYLATYTTVKWTGNLEAREIDVATATPSKTASWCAENVVAGSCPAPGAIVAEEIASATFNYCVTPIDTDHPCDSPGIVDGTNCKLEMQITCTGTMASKVDATADNNAKRTIYVKPSSGHVLLPFVSANVNAADFDAARQAGLSQWSSLTAEQKLNATVGNLVQFLRGQYGYEDRASNAADKRIYRYREATLGDVVESRPYFVGKPIFSYTDAGYSAFVSANDTDAERPRTVYMGANDGMLHAFDADNGEERWAYVPSMVIPNMWKLADKNYSTMHSYYVNGNPVVGDVYDGTNWHTILVAGLNGGGRGYYALDITDPLIPTFLWEFTTANDSDLGYSFGPPVITKKADGTWVVLLTSGYNNTSPGDGKGYLYVRDALTGAAVASHSKITTDVGDESGLARIATWADDPEKNNTAGYTYGGDLLGNLWRFDINTGTVMKFAELKGPDNTTPQPITARPTLGKVDGKRVVFVGTGKYLETSDLTNTKQQSVYAIKDDNESTTLANPRTSTTMVEQTLTTSGATRMVSSNDVSGKRGWYIDFPQTDPEGKVVGERVNVNPLLAWGALIVPTIVPSNTVCSPGGYGWLNYFNYKTGGTVPGAEDDLAGQKFDSPIVGITPVVKTDGTGEILATTGDGDLKKPPKKIISGGGTSGFTGKRVIWRELIQ